MLSFSSPPPSCHSAPAAGFLHDLSAALPAPRTGRRRPPSWPGRLDAGGERVARLGSDSTRLGLETLTHWRRQVMGLAAAAAGRSVGRRRGGRPDGGVPAALHAKHHDFGRLWAGAAAGSVRGEPARWPDAEVSVPILVLMPTRAPETGPLGDLGGRVFLRRLELEGRVPRCPSAGVSEII